MQLVEPRNLLPPSICIICETQPDGEAVVDTLYNLKTGVATPLNGRKYVCERCVKEFGKLFGLEEGNEVAKAKHALEQKEQEVARIRQNVDDFAKALADVVNHPSVSAQGSFEDVFQPPALEAVRTASASRVSQIQSSGVEEAPKAKRTKTERAAVPHPGLEVDEEADV